MSFNPFDEDVKKAEAKRLAEEAEAEDKPEAEAERLFEDEEAAKVGKHKLQGDSQRGGQWKDLLFLQPSQCTFLQKFE